MSPCSYNVLNQCLLFIHAYKNQENLDCSNSFEYYFPQLRSCPGTPLESKMTPRLQAGPLEGCQGTKIWQYNISSDWWHKVRYQVFMMLSFFVATTQIFVGLPRPWQWRREKSRRRWHRLILTGNNIHSFVPWDDSAHWKYDVVWSFLKTLGLLGAMYLPNSAQLANQTGLKGYLKFH